MSDWNPTPSQQAVVAAWEGPQRVVAGPGSGKTTTLIERIAVMLEHGVRADQILALTFSRKAAEAIRNKVRQRIGSDVAVYTYHAFAATLLDEYADRRAALLSGAEGWRMLDALARDHHLRGFAEAQAPKTALLALAFIERMQQELLLPEDVQAYVAGAPPCPPGADAAAWAERLERLATLADLYARYQAQKRGDPARDDPRMDFGDQVLEAVRLLWTQADTRQEVQERYPYLLLDEYQDTNFAQGVLVALLIGPEAHVLAVGDEDQSVYGFQGATQENIVRFPELATLGGRQVGRHTLAENFRSVPDIVNLARDFVGTQKPLRATREGRSAPAVTLAEMVSAPQQAEYVVQAILRRQEREVRAWKDFAVLSANKAAFAPVRQALRDAGIPFQVVGRSGLLAQAEARDVLAYAHLVDDPAAGLALARVLRRPPLRLSHASIRTVLDRPPGERVAPLARLGDLSPLATARLEDLRTWLAATRGRAAYEGVRWTVNQIIAYTGHATRAATGRTADPEGTRAVLHRLLDLAEEMDRARGTLGDWLAYLRLLADRQEEPGGDEPAETDTVKLLTIHASKGLEWPVVFLIDALALPRNPREVTAYLRRDPRTLAWDNLDGAWNRPVGVAADLDRLTLLATPDAAALEPEERRLTYVGMTRAADELLLVCPSGRAKPNDTPLGQTRLLEYMQKAGVVRVKRGGTVERGYIGELLNGYLARRCQLDLRLLDATEAEMAAPPAALAERRAAGARLRAALAAVDAGEVPALDPVAAVAVARLDTEDPLPTDAQPAAALIRAEDLAVYARCPRQYRYRFESRLPEDPVIRQQREAWEARRARWSSSDDVMEGSASGETLVWRLPMGALAGRVDRLTRGETGVTAAFLAPDVVSALAWPADLAVQAAVALGALVQQGRRAADVHLRAVADAGPAVALPTGDLDAAALNQARLSLLLRQRQEGARAARVGPSCKSCGYTAYCAPYRKRHQDDGSATIE